MSTAAETLVAAVIAGMNNGWTFEQSKEVALRTMIDQDPSTMRQLLALFS